MFQALTQRVGAFCFGAIMRCGDDSRIDLTAASSG
jgi:hypothetical protein